jgi:hypothetical protein
MKANTLMHTCQGDVGDFGIALEAAGYRGDRLSIWGVQVRLPWALGQTCT